MTLVNCAVVHQRTHKMVFPWNILNSHLDGVSVGGYYSEIIKPIIDLPQEEKQRLILSKGLLGKSKDALDMIDLDDRSKFCCEYVWAFSEI